KHYDNRLSQTFVRDWKRETKEATEAAFKKYFPHAEAVNALASVALELDSVMIDLADQFGPQLLNQRKNGDKWEDWIECGPDVSRSRARQGKCRCKVCYQARQNIIRVKSDVGTARASSKPLWLDYVCDFRGRVYATQYLNYQREDHVRAMFRFAK